MRLRSAGILLCAVVLAACGEGTVFPDTRLAGDWISNGLLLEALFPDGTHTVDAVEEIELRPDGRFHRERRLLDQATHLVVIELAEEGTYFARDGVLHANVERSYYRGTGEPLTRVSLLPTARTDEYSYTLRGGVLTLLPVCPPNAMCVEPPFTQFKPLLATPVN